MSIAAYISGGIGPGASILFFTTRGLSIGTPAAGTETAGIEWTAPSDRLHFDAPSDRLHFEVLDDAD